MTKYRKLTLEELENFEKEFIDFLVINGILAEEWEKMKSDNPEAVSAIIESFSEVVFESIMRKTKYIDIIEEGKITSFQCLDNKLLSVSASVTSSSPLDFNFKSLLNFNNLSDLPDHINYSQYEKPYENDRNTELFLLYEMGGIKSDGQIFKWLWMNLLKKNDSK